MAAIINTNIASLNAQRNLNTSQSSLSTSLQRLSSGLRINSAKDDAAGLAIAERFTSQIRGLNQAGRNANDGISLAQTAEGALSTVSDNLQRIRELAVQAANSTNSTSDRAALDQEVQQRIAEIDRISSQTAFNGLKVLDGTFGNSQFQVGANTGETISVNLAQGTKASQIGQIATGTSGAVNTTALSGTGTIQVGSASAVTIGASVAGAQAGQTAGSAYAKVNAINAAGVPGLTATATNNIEFNVADVSNTGAGTTSSTYSLKVNGVDIFSSAAVAGGGSITKQQITDAINAQSSNTGVTASISGGKLYLSAADGRDITVGQDVTAGTGTVAAGVGLAAQTDGAETLNGVSYRDGAVGTTASASVNGGTINLSATENIVIKTDGANLGFAAADTTIARDTKTLSSVSVTSVVNANDAIKRIDAALSTVSGIRSTLGAIQNRFESTISNLQTTSENLTASRSRIQDADFAAETANLTRGQILQQAGTAMLAQANSLPNGVLALLRG